MVGDVRTLGKQFAELFSEETYSIEANNELLSIKGRLVTAFQDEPGLLKDPQNIGILTNLRLKMNIYFFANDLEREIVDGLQEKAFRFNAHLVTEEKVSEYLGKVVNEDREWGAYLAIAGTMVKVNPKALNESSLASVESWANARNCVDRRDMRRTHVRWFVERTGLQSANL